MKNYLLVYLTFRKLYYSKFYPLFHCQDFIYLFVILILLATHLKILLITYINQVILDYDFRKITIPQIFIIFLLIFIGYFYFSIFYLIVFIRICE